MGELLVVKVGTNASTKDTRTGRKVLDTPTLRLIGKQVQARHSKEPAGDKVAMVVSGAIAEGMRIARAKDRPSKSETSQLQLFACLGQVALMNAYQRALGDNLRAGQLLFTNRELMDKFEGKTLQEVTLLMLESGYVPIANENDALSSAEITFGDNDALSSAEITFGDNDILAARFAALLHRSELFERTRLILLTDVDHVHDQNKQRIEVIEDIESYEDVVDGNVSKGGTGGMGSKFKAAKIVTKNGIEMYVANGRTANVISRTLAREIGTYFPASSD